MAVTACSRKRPTWHVREEAGKCESKPSFLSRSLDTHNTEWVINMKYDLTYYMNHVKTDTADKVH